MQDKDRQFYIMWADKRKPSWSDTQEEGASFLRTSGESGALYKRGNTGPTLEVKGGK
jgi:hypothetical protein